MNVDVQHDPKARRYFAKVDGDEAEASYIETGERSVNFTHTYVPPEMRGQGVGEAVVRFALDDLRGRGYTYTAACPFVVAYLERHPEYQETSKA